MSNSPVEQLIKNWNRVHKQTAKVIAAAPDDKLDWRPSPKSFTLGELIAHFPQAEEALVKIALGGSLEEAKAAGRDLTGKPAAEIVEAFNQRHDQLVEQVSPLTADQLAESVEFHGRVMPRAALLHGMVEHEIHHRGQLITYLRILDVEPPKIY